MEDLAAGIDALLPFRPMLRRGAEPGRWRGGEKDASGVIQMPWFEFSDELDAFRDALGHGGWIQPFDWPSWGDEVKRYMDEPERVMEADAATIGKLFTAHVRADRFNEGHLASVVRSGHIGLLLDRLAVIRAEL